MKNDYKNEFPELKIFHRVFEVTKEILELLFDRVEKGVIIVLDDYNSVSGAKKAINEFFLEYKFKKLPYYSILSFVIK